MKIFCPTCRKSIRILTETEFTGSVMCSACGTVSSLRVLCEGADVARLPAASTSAEVTRIEMDSKANNLEDWVDLTDATDLQPAELAASARGTFTLPCVVAPRPKRTAVESARRNGASSSARFRWMFIGAAFVAAPLLVVILKVVLTRPEAPASATATQPVASASHKNPAIEPGIEAPSPGIQPPASQNSQPVQLGASSKTVDPAPAKADVVSATAPVEIRPAEERSPATRETAIAAGPLTKKTSNPAAPPDRATQPAIVTTRASQLPSPVIVRESLMPQEIPLVGDIGDEEVERSIRAGIEYLASQFDSNVRMTYAAKKALSKRNGETSVASGENALAVYALLQAGLAVHDERLNPRGELGKGLLDGVKKVSPEGMSETYATALRASCLSVVNRKEDLAVLTRDVRLLTSGHEQGGYSYQLVRPPGGDRDPSGAMPPTTEIGPDREADTEPERDDNMERQPRAKHIEPPLHARAPFDNSNSQYGLLGVWAGADAGIEVPASYWKTADAFWKRNQQPSGQWSYGGPQDASQPDGRRSVFRASQSMTAAGLASLFVIHDYLDTTRDDAPVGRDPYPPALACGLKWWETDNHAIEIDRTGWPGYSLYGIERVGLASGLKYFGENDWYRVLAKKIIADQRRDGGWAGKGVGGYASPAVYDTAYALLFLSRGRHPLMMNKLRFDGFWANRPRDVANLSRFASRQLERPLNWQVVDLKHPWYDWLDAPILYIASHVAPKFTPQDYDQFRNFVLAGGMIYTQSDDASKEFDGFAVELGKKLFPQYEFEDLPPDHPLFTSALKVKPQTASLRAIRNGSRILMLHCPSDIAESWQLRKHDEVERFKLGTNIFVYAGGRRDLHNRLQTTYVPEPSKTPPSGRVSVARLQHTGDWDPEPWAWTRFGRLFQFHTGTGIDVVNVKWKDLAPATAPLVHLTGTGTYRPTNAERAALKAYVEAGGVVLVDDCGGSGAFSSSMEQSLQETFGNDALQPATSDHPLFRTGQPGMADLTKPSVRQFVIERNIRNGFPHFIAAGRGHVIFSRLDVISGLLGTNTWGITGYTPSYCEAFMQNILFWTMDGQHDVLPALDKPK